MAKNAIGNDVLQAIYDLWVESEEYGKSSALENERYKESTENVKGVVGDDAYHKITDDIARLGCYAEIAGFDAGFRYGIMFMSGMLGGAA